MILWRAFSVAFPLFKESIESKTMHIFVLARTLSSFFKAIAISEKLFPYNFLPKIFLMIVSCILSLFWWLKALTIMNLYF